MSTRTKETSSSNAIKVDGKWQVEKTTVLKEYDPIFSKWLNKKTETKIVGLDTLKPIPVKRIEREVLLKRPAYNSFEDLYCYARQKITVEVQPFCEDLFISESSRGVLIQTDLANGQACPLTLKGTPNIKVIREKPIQISKEEFDALKKTGLRCFSENPRTGEVSVELSLS